MTRGKQKQINHSAAGIWPHHRVALGIHNSLLDPALFFPCETLCTLW